MSTPHHVETVTITIQHGDNPHPRAVTITAGEAHWIAARLLDGARAGMVGATTDALYSAADAAKQVAGYLTD